MKKLILLLLFLVSLKANAQCPAGTAPTAYGSGSWIGYVFDGVQNFTNYQGSITESENFDDSFCGDNCNFNTSNCSVQTETFTVRFKMQKNFPNAVYRIVIGGDDGVRVSTNGGSSWLLNAWNNQGYTTYSTLLVINGNTNMVFEYYENDGANRVSFSDTNLGAAYGGLIGSSQSFCQAGTVDPAAFTSTEPGMFVTAGTVQYQWESSPDNATWTNVASATALTYDIPAGYSGVRYYRRRAYNGTATAYSNTVVVKAQTASADQSTYGNGTWIGYVYDGANNFTAANFVGAITEARTFDENFGGDANTFATTGCDVYAETFSVRYKMTVTLACGDYKFTIGGDDGVRLSIDGGATYLIDDFNDHGYRPVTHTGTVRLNGTYNFILDFYENAGANRVTFNYTTTSCMLPVTLTEFTGEAVNETSVLKWATATEKNNSGFIIERSAAGTQYDSIGFIAGNINTTTRQTYTFTDNHPLYGRNYYRLKQVDLDRRYEYSGLVTVIQKDAPALQVYPNPTSDYLILETRQEIISQTLISAITNQPINTTLDGHTLRFPNTPPGLYILIIRTTESTLYKNIIIK